MKFLATKAMLGSHRSIIGNGVENGIVKTKHVRVPYRYHPQKTALTRNPSSAESAIRPKKKVKYQVQIHVRDLPATTTASCLLYYSKGAVSCPQSYQFWPLLSRHRTFMCTLHSDLVSQPSGGIFVIIYAEIAIQQTIRHQPSTSNTTTLSIHLALFPRS